MACKKKNPERQIFTTNITTIGIQSFNLLGNFSKIIQEKENIYIVNLIFLGPENIIQEQLNFIHPEIELLNPEESFIEPNADLNQNFNHEVIYTVKRKKNEEKAVITTNPETDQEREQGIIYKVRVKIQNLKDLSDKICAFSVDQTQGFIRYISENKADINLYFFDDQPNLTNIVPTIKLCDEQAKLAPAANIPQNFTKSVTYFGISADQKQQTNYKTKTIYLKDEAKLKSFKIKNIFGKIDHLQNKIFLKLSSQDFGSGLLTPDIVVSEGSTILPKSSEAVQFKNYSITNVFYYDYVLASEKKERIYRVLIYTDAVKLKNAKITQFTILGQNAEIDENNKKISLNLTENQFGTGNLTPTISYIGKKIVPNSGMAQQFISGQAKKYTVTAEDETTEIDYEVFINRLSNAAKITQFTILEQNAEIDENNKKISLNLTENQFNNRKLTPAIVISDKAIVNPASLEEQNFTSGVPKNYVVTAEDGTQITYQVIVKILSTENNLETIKVKNQISNAEILGIINNTDNTITFDNYNLLRDYKISELAFKGKSLSINTNPVYNCNTSPCVAMPTAVFNNVNLLKNYEISVISESEENRVYTILTADLSNESKLNTISIKEGSNIILGNIDEINKKITFNDVNSMLIYQISDLTFTGKSLDVKKGATIIHNCNSSPCNPIPSTTFNSTNLLTDHKIVITSIAAGTTRNVNEYEIIVNYLPVLPIPTNIVATHAMCGPDQTLDLSWNPVTNAGKYKISYRRGNSGVFTNLEINAPNTSTKIEIPQNQTDVAYEIKIQALATNPVTHANSEEALVNSTLRNYQMKDVESFTAKQKGDNIFNHEISWKLADGESGVQTGTVSYKWINTSNSISEVTTHTYEQILEKNRTDYLKLEIIPKTGCLAPPSKEIKVTTANMMDFDIELLPNVAVTLNPACSTVYVTDGNQLDFSQNNNYVLENNITMPADHTTGNYDCVLDGKGYTIFGLKKTLLYELKKNAKIVNVIFEIDKIAEPVICSSSNLNTFHEKLTVIINNVIIKIDSLVINNGSVLLNSSAVNSQISQVHLRIRAINIPSIGGMEFGLMIKNSATGSLISQSSIMVQNPILTNENKDIPSVSGLVGEHMGTITESFVQIEFNISNYVGGLVGFNNGTINNSIFNGRLMYRHKHFLIADQINNTKISNNLYSGGIADFKMVGDNIHIPNSNYAPFAEGVTNQGETRVIDLNTETFNQLDNKIWYKEQGKWPILKWYKDRLDAKKK